MRRFLVSCPKTLSSVVLLSMISEIIKQEFILVGKNTLESQIVRIVKDLKSYPAQTVVDNLMSSLVENAY